MVRYWIALIALVLAGLLFPPFAAAQPAVTLVREVFIVDKLGQLHGPHHGSVSAGERILYRITGQNNRLDTLRAGEVRVFGQFDAPDGLRLEIDWASLSVPRGFVRQGALTALRWVSNSLIYSGATFQFSYEAEVVVAAPAPPPHPVVVNPGNVSYRVTLPLGCRGLVTLSGVGGSTEQHEVRSGWTYSFHARPGDHLYLSAQNHCDRGTVSVAIVKDGAVYRTATSSGAYVIASASGTY